LTQLTNNQSKKAHALDEMGSGKGQDFPSWWDGNVKCGLEDRRDIPDNKNTALRIIWLETTERNVRNCDWKMEVSDSQERSHVDESSNDVGSSNQD